MDWTGSSAEERREMLAAIGVDSVEELISGIPRQVEALPGLPGGLDEASLLRHVSALAGRNRPAGPGKCFIGAGAYEHATPAVVEALVSRGEFSTTYTPYQPEVSQGTLIAAFEFQTLIARLTGLDAANSSMYDGASATAEAALLAMRQTGRKEVAVSGAVHPEWTAVIRTYLSGVGAHIRTVPDEGGRTPLRGIEAVVDGDVACVVVQQPSFFGQLEDLRAAAKAAHAAGALFVAACNPLALGILASPGECGADIAVGDVQPLGIPLNFGGPYAGYMAVREGLVRQMPGRLVGMARDSRGRRGFTLTLQTREQHIRRERATSNICTNQALVALAATVYLCLLGKQGLRDVARQNAVRARRAAERLLEIPGVSLAFDGPFFNEFVLRLPRDAAEVCRRVTERTGIWPGLDLGRFRQDLADCLMVCVTETKTAEDVEALKTALEDALR